MKKLIPFLIISAVVFLSACENPNADASEKNSAALKNMEEYFKTHDTAFVATDAVFKNMTTGEETKGRQAIAGMLHYMYHVAFEAEAEVKHTIITDKNAVLEANFTGKHIGEFAGMPATGNSVNVPLCVTYDLNSAGLIQEARIYMLTDVMMPQLMPK